MATARDSVISAEKRARLLPGDDERFSGWGLMGLPFASGDVLATRSFAASSVGSGYTSVWYRSPSNEWTFYADTSPETACTRYFGSGATRAVACAIRLEWRGEDTLSIEVPEAELSCEIKVGTTPASRAMNGIAAVFPEWAWRNPRMLGLTARVAGRILGAGKLSMAGTTPNRQRFIANARKLWVVRSARLKVGERETTQLGPVTPQAKLGDFLIPQRGLLAIGNAAFENYDPARHSNAVSQNSGR